MRNAHRGRFSGIRQGIIRGAAMPVTTGRPLSWSFMELSLVCCLLGGQARYEAFINAVNEDLCMEYDGP